LKKRGADTNLARLLREIHANYPFLFAKYGCRVVKEQCHGDPSLDHAIVVIDAGAFRLCAARDRGDTLWSIARADTPQSWRPVEDVFRATESDLNAIYSTPPMLDKHFADIEPFLAAVPPKQ